MIKLMNKQDIILMYIRDKKSKRAIARETGFARKTVDKYINEYETNLMMILNAKNLFNSLQISLNISHLQELKR